MSPAGRLAPYAVLVFLFAPLYFFSMPLTALGDVSCTKGTSRPATASDIETMKAAGILNATVGEEYCPDDLNAGAVAGQAKQYLRSIVCSGSKFGGTTPDETVEKLDAKFAVCAAKFLKEASGQLSGGVSLYNGGSNPVCLREGFRTVAQQEKYAEEYRRGGGIACTKGANCEHPRGIAIDVNTAPVSNYSKLHQMGKQFGVNFYLPVKDKVHFVPAISSCTGGGGARTGTLDSTYYDFPNDYRSSTATAPTSAFANGLRQMLGMSPQTTATTQTTPTTQTQAQICTPEFSCTGNTMYYQTTSCTKQVYQTCPYGCNGSSCNLSTSTAATTDITVSTVLTGTTSESANTNSNTNTNADTEATTTQSVSDLLNSYFDPRPVEIGTSTSIVFRLNAETGDIEQLDQRKTVSTIRPAQETISSIQPVNAQQTFTSGDLSGYTSSYYGSTQASGFQKALDNMKAALLWALSVLRPFGGGTVDHQFAP